MIACTRSEILDYSNRVSKFGQEIADKKRPNSFTFEIWDFMQNAKRNSGKNDPVQTVDGSTTNQLSTDDNASQQEQSSANGNETHVLSDDEVNEDDDDLFNWYSYLMHDARYSNSCSVWLNFFPYCLFVSRTV